MSGGVDSSVCAILLLERGFSVEGATFSLSHFKKSDKQDLIDAKNVCDMLGIQHHIFDFNDIFEQEVITPFCDEYFIGNTPNPCIICNETIKFGAFYHLAMDLGFDAIATGHYAKILNGRLYCASSSKKDQSYFLYRIKRDILKNIYFPLGELTKEEVRDIASKHNLSNHKKSDSQDICFIDGDYSSFLKKRYKNLPKTGYFIDGSSNVLGKHSGIFNYTIGQRRGLNISLGKRVFVSKINASNNSITLSSEDKLYRDTLSVKNFNILIDIHTFENIISDNLIKVKIRSSSKFYPAKLKICNDKINVHFLENVRAITNGQSAVFYLDDLVLGGGIIAF